MQFIGRSSVAGLDIDPGSGGNRFRAERFRQFMTIVNDVLAEKGFCRVLDVGGTISYWRTYAGELPPEVSVTLLNIDPASEPDLPLIKHLTGDACAMPEFADKSFDVVHSNSVIEHVGLWQRMASMAQEIRRVAPRYYVQTPNFWFPIEPHYRLPLVHFLPEAWRRSLLMGKARGFLPKAADIGAASATVNSAILLDYRQMAFLFPDATIERERFLGLTKSLVAIKHR